MTVARGAWARVAATALVVAMASGACSKPDRPHISTSARILPGGGMPAPPSTPPVDPDLSASPTSPHRESIEYDGAPLSYIVTETFEASVTTVDPDDAIVQAARAFASRCLVSVQGGPDVLSAVLEVSVVPSGRVSRTAVTSQVTAPEVLDCLVRTGNGLRFSSREGSQSDAGDSTAEGIRSFSIDVTVARSH